MNKVYHLNSCKFILKKVPVWLIYIYLWFEIRADDYKLCIFIVNDTSAFFLSKIDQIVHIFNNQFLNLLQRVIFACLIKNWTYIAYKFFISIV